MAFKNFIKENIVLVIGLLLPLLLVFLFILSSAIPRMMATAPAYDFLFSINQYDNTQNAKLAVNLKVDKNGKVIAVVRNTETAHRYYPELYRYRAKDGYATAVKSKHFLDEILDNESSIKSTKTIGVPNSVARLELNDDSVSPDGYTLDTSRNYGSNGIAGEIFYGRKRGCSYRLIKGNAVFSFEVHNTNNNYRHCSYYSNSSFKLLGWVIPNNKAGE